MYAYRVTFAAGYLVAHRIRMLLEAPLDNVPRLAALPRRHDAWMRITRNAWAGTSRIHRFGATIIDPSRQYKRAFCVECPDRYPGRVGAPE